MGFDVKGFKVIYKDIVYRAINFQQTFGEQTNEGDSIRKPKFLDVVVINEDGNVMFLNDEAWMFQFMPTLK